jgi:hypothetical protein
LITVKISESADHNGLAVRRNRPAEGRCHDSVGRRKSGVLGQGSAPPPGRFYKNISSIINALFSSNDNRIAAYELSNLRKGISVIGNCPQAFGVALADLRRI